MNAADISRKPSLAGAKALLAASNLPTVDITPEHCEHFYYVGRHAEPEGLIGLEILGEVALLRSLVVAEFRRATGAGTALLEHAEREAGRAGVSTIYLLTTTAERFFAKRGYRQAERASAPESIRLTREFSGLCPASSTFMVKHLGA